MKKICLEKSHCIFWLFTSYSAHSAWKTSKYLVSVWFLLHFSWGHLKSSHDAAKTTHLKDGLFPWKITILTLRDISVPTNWNNYKFFSMTQKVWKLIWWSITWQRIQKYIRKLSLLQPLKINNGGIENEQIAKITNVEKHRNIRKWGAIEFVFWNIRELA